MRINSHFHYWYSPQQPGVYCLLLRRTRGHIYWLSCCSKASFNTERAQYLRPHPSRLCSPSDFLHRLSPGVLIRPRHKHRPDVADQGCGDRKTSCLRREQKTINAEDTDKEIERVVGREATRIEENSGRLWSVPPTSCPKGRHGRRVSVTHCPRRECCCSLVWLLWSTSSW